jgi:hypothetical protein
VHDCGTPSQTYRHVLIQMGSVVTQKGACQGQHCWLRYGSQTSVLWWMEGALLLTWWGVQRDGGCTAVAPPI